MKYLLRVLFILALSCGFASHAHATLFHVGNVDPNSCGPNNLSACSIIDANGPITGFTFDTSACNASGIPAGAFCLDLFNQTSEVITSITLSIPDSALEGLTPVCDTTASFTGSCTMLPDGTDVFTFTGVPGQPFGPGVVDDLYVSGIGIDPTIFDNGATLVVAATPEPDSLLLFSTGVMMAGLYLGKRHNLFAFGKK
jgi:hypothetical protein